MIKEVVRIHFESIDSTNTWAKTHISELDPDKLTLITAEIQTAGRGRDLRQWISPKGNLIATFCFAVPDDRPIYSSLSLLMGITASEVLSEYEVFPKLKWPNDLMVKNKKLGGILTESTTHESNRWYFLGIGININMPLNDLIKIDQPSTSLFEIINQESELLTIVEDLTNQFQTNLSYYLQEGFGPFLSTYRSLLIYKVGQILNCKNGTEFTTGEFDSVSSDGTINLKLLDNTFYKVYSGELTE